MNFDLAGVRGVLPSQWLRKAFDSGIIVSPVYARDEAQFQPASLDLRLGDWAYRLRCSFLPGAATVERALSSLKMGDVDLRDGAILERNRPYLIPLSESLDLPAGIIGRANPKSSTGRLDIFTRVITDRNDSFDSIPKCYKGKLYLEVVSRSFTIKVQRGLSLNQLRLAADSVAVSDEEIRSIHDKKALLYAHGRAVPEANLSLSNGLFLNISLDREGEAVGWRARKNSHLLDLTSLGSHDPNEFWDRVYPEPGGGIVLEPEEFYLLLSQEQIAIPPDLAAEMIAYDPTSGELRTHYAGFFDPGFGYSPDADMGSYAALEVRAHDVAFKLRNGQRICKLSFERLAEEPDVPYGSTGSHYQFQTLALSKHFRTAREDERPSSAETEPTNHLADQMNPLF